MKDAIIEHLRSVAPVAWTIGTLEKKFGLDGLSEAFDAMDVHPDIAREVSMHGLAYRYVGKPTEEVKNDELLRYLWRVTVKTAHRGTDHKYYCIDELPGLAEICEV